MKKKKQIHSTETTNKQDPRPYYPVKLLRNSFFNAHSQANLSVSEKQNSNLIPDTLNSKQTPASIPAVPAEQTTASIPTEQITVFNTSKQNRFPKKTKMSFYDGAIEVTARSALNQTHKLIIDTILMLAHKNDSFFFTQSTTGLPMIACVIRYSDLIKIYNRHSDTLKQNITDIVQTALKMDVKTVCTIIEPIISAVKFTSAPSIPNANLSEKEKQKIKTKIQEILNSRNPKQRSNNYTAENQTIQDNSIIIVTFSSVFSTMLRINLRLNYSPEILAKLRKIKSGAVLAIINFILTQKTPYTIKAETIANYYDINISVESTKKNFLYALKQHTETFAEFGIEYDSTKKMFSYSVNNSDIGFSTPPNDVLGTFLNLEEVKNSPERTATIKQLAEKYNPPKPDNE